MKGAIDPEWTGSLLRNQSFECNTNTYSEKLKHSGTTRFFNYLIPPGHGGFGLSHVKTKCGVYFQVVKHDSAICA